MSLRIYNINTHAKLESNIWRKYKVI